MGIKRKPMATIPTFRPTKKQRVAAMAGAAKVAGSDAESLVEFYELGLDRLAVGTSGYRGRAYFWAGAYKHTLRDVTDSGRRRVHKAWLQHGLSLSGESYRHYTVMMASLTKRDFKRLDDAFGESDHSVLSRADYEEAYAW